MGSIKNWLIYKYKNYPYVYINNHISLKSANHFLVGYAKMPKIDSDYVSNPRIYVQKAGKK